MLHLPFSFKAEQRSELCVWSVPEKYVQNVGRSFHGHIARLQYRTKSVSSRMCLQLLLMGHNPSDVNSFWRRCCEWGLYRWVHTTLIYSADARKLMRAHDRCARCKINFFWMAQMDLHGCHFCMYSKHRHPSPQTAVEKRLAFLFLTLVGRVTFSTFAHHGAFWK